MPANSRPRVLQVARSGCPPRAISLHFHRGGADRPARVGVRWEPAEAIANGVGSGVVGACVAVGVEYSYTNCQVLLRISSGECRRELFFLFVFARVGCGDVAHDIARSFPKVADFSNARLAQPFRFFFDCLFPLLRHCFPRVVFRSRLDAEIVQRLSFLEEKLLCLPKTAAAPKLWTYLVADGRVAPDVPATRFGSVRCFPLPRLP